MSSIVNRFHLKAHTKTQILPLTIIASDTCIAASFNLNVCICHGFARITPAVNEKITMIIWSFQYLVFLIALIVVEFNFNWTFTYLVCALIIYTASECNNSVDNIRHSLKTIKCQLIGAVCTCAR